MPTCPDGHTSVATDYCDVCGSPIAAASPPPTPSATPADCPACHAPSSGRFCEACGHDSALPAPVPAPTPADPEGTAPVNFGWTALVAADRAFYDRVLACGGPDTVEFPDYFPERRITLRRRSNLIGRRNRDHGVEPEIDLAIHPADRGVSTQHAVLRIRESGLTVTDLGSTNGTTLNESTDFLVNGDEIPLSDGDRIHLGAWTTITMRRDG